MPHGCSAPMFTGWVAVGGQTRQVRPGSAPRSWPAGWRCAFPRSGGTGTGARRFRHWCTAGRPAWRTSKFAGGDARIAQPGWNNGVHRARPGHPVTRRAQQRPGMQRRPGHRPQTAKVLAAIVRPGCGLPQPVATARSAASRRPMARNSGMRAAVATAFSPPLWSRRPARQARPARSRGTARPTAPTSANPAHAWWRSRPPRRARPPRRRPGAAATARRPG